MTVYQRETREFQPVRVAYNGYLVTTGVEVCVTAERERPTTWQTPTTVGDQVGVMVTGYPPGQYRVWVRVNDTTEQPVLYAGTITIQ